MDGVNDVGEVKVSRLQVEGESEDRRPEHKVKEEEEGDGPSVVRHTGVTA